MRKALPSAYVLLALCFAVASCDREKAEYGESPQPVEIAAGRLSLSGMSLVCSDDTETYDAVLRPDAAADVSSFTGHDAVRAARPSSAASGRTRSGAADDPSGYRCRLVDAAQAVVAEFAYRDRPETFDLPAGAYTLEVRSGDPQPAVWETPSYAASQEVLVLSGATVSVGEVICTPAVVGVSLAFDERFDEQSSVTVDCGGEALRFTPAEERTAYFAVGEARTLTLAVAGTLVSGRQVAYTGRCTDVQPGRSYRFTVKGEALAAPEIEWIDHDIRQRYRAVEGLDARIRITAPAGIRSFLVEIVSEEVLTPEVLESVGLQSSFDLTQPGDLQEILEALGFPTGDDVTDRDEVSFDITQFMGLIPLLGNGDSDFRLTVTDNEAQSTTESVMVYSSDEPEDPDPEPDPDPDPDPDAPEQGYPGGEARPLAPPRAEQEYPGGEARPLEPPRAEQEYPGGPADPLPAASEQTKTQ